MPSEKNNLPRNVSVLRTQSQLDEAVIRAFVESMRDGVILADQDGQIRSLNSAAREIFGWQESDPVGMALTVLMPARFRAQHEAGLRRLQQTGQSTILGTNQTLEGRRRTGETFPLELSLSQWDFGGTSMYCGVVRDVSERLVEQRERRLLTHLADRVRSCANPEQAIENVTAEFAHASGWLLAEVWRPTVAGDRLELTHFWMADVIESRRSAMEEFIRASEAVSYARGEGLPGKVWEQGTSHWIADVAALGVEAFPRHPKAADADLHAALGIPVTMGNQFVAAVLFFLDVPANQDVWLAESAQKVMRQLDTVLLGKQAECELKEYKAALESAVEGISRLSPNGIYEEMNETYAGTLGYSPVDLLGTSWVRTVHPEDLTTAEKAYARMKQTGKAEAEIRGVRSDGSILRMRVVMIRRQEEKERFQGHYCFMDDTTDRSEKETALHEAHQQLELKIRQMEAITEQAQQLQYMSDLLRAVDSRPEAYRVVAHSMGQLFPANPGALYAMSPSRDVLEAVAVWGTPEADFPPFGVNDCWALRRGRMHVMVEPAKEVVCPHVRDSAGGSICVPLLGQAEMLGVLHVSPLNAGASLEDLSRRAVNVQESLALALANIELQEKLRNQAVRDPLTGLYNRRYLEESLDREVQRAIRHQFPLSVMMLDVDHFKRFNDSFGHAAGDAFLRKFAELLQRATRREDIACRFGGEEFVVVLLEASGDNAAIRAEEIRQNTEKMQIEVSGRSLLSTTVSIGIASLRPGETKAASLLQSADDALYRAKAAGRNRVER